MASVLDRDADFGANWYIDTRDGSHPVPFTKAVIEGIAPSGGLYVPAEIPRMTTEQICALAGLPYWKRAALIYKLFNVDLADATIDELMQKSYSDNFDSEEICPIVSPCGEGSDAGLFVLELWHGPTSAFKDLALQCMPHFFSASARELRHRGEIDCEFCILVATSGDTGKAALSGFADVPGVKIGVLFPNEGVSDIQRKQMITSAGSNVHVWGVRGNFDDCQTAVKRVFADEAFTSHIASSQKVAFSSANSINWGRLLPQVVYYVSSYAEIVARGALHAGDKIDICVPCGNFGNILAAFYALQMGVPIKRLICASNENRVLTDFIDTGVYDIKNRRFVLTPSPSMDILVSSNLEREIFELSGRDSGKVAGYMRSLSDMGRFEISSDIKARIQDIFAADSVDNVECLQTIRVTYEKYGYLMDPHTSVAFTVAERLRENRPMLVASTAHWAKFGNNVYRALHGIGPEQPLPEKIASLSGCQLNDLISAETGKTDIPAGLLGLDEAPARFNEVIDADVSDVEASVEKFIATRRSNG